jgi:hypothetical protein
MVDPFCYLYRTIPEIFTKLLPFTVHSTLLSLEKKQRENRVTMLWGTQGRGSFSGKGGGSVWRMVRVDIRFPCSVVSEGGRGGGGAAPFLSRASRGRFYPNPGAGRFYPHRGAGKLYPHHRAGMY